MPKNIKIYYYYHGESDSLWSQLHEWDPETDNPDGCTDPVSRKIAMEIRYRQSERYIYMEGEFRNGE